MEILYKTDKEIGDTIIDTAPDGTPINSKLVSVEIYSDGKITDVFWVLENGIKIQVGFKTL